MAQRQISIWFFIGISLLGNGLLILGAGIAQLLHPPTGPRVVLYQLHANVWWGALLLGLGLFYCLRYAPRARRPAADGRSRARKAAS